MQLPRSSPASSSRPLKKKREESPMNPIAPEKLPSKKLFFDLLELDAIENTTRFLSSVPNAKFWPGGISSDDVSSLYGVPGEYSRFITSRFDEIYLTSEEHRFRDREDSGITLENAELAFNMALAAGENLKMVHWEDDGYGIWDDFPIEDRIHELSAKCKNLKSLSFRKCYTDTWIEVFGQRLKSLAFYGGYACEDVVSAASRCTQIKELTVEFVDRSNLGLSNLWKNIGNTLEVLNLGLLAIPALQDEGEEEIRQIRKYCRKLIDINIHGTIVPVSRSELALCLSSYGPQLESATIKYDRGKSGEASAEELEYVALQLVVRKCTNACFNLELRDCKIFDFLSLVGKRLESISFTPRYIEEDGSADLTPAWDLCPNIQDIYFTRRMNHREVNAVFNSPKLFLRKVKLNLKDESTDLKKVMLAFASGGVITLEDVDFEVRLPPSNTFDKLVEMNKSLRKARIFIKGAEKEQVIGRVLEITRCFFRSPAIKYLEIEEFQEMFRPPRSGRNAESRVSAPSCSRSNIRKHNTMKSLLPVYELQDHFTSGFRGIIPR